MNFLESKVSISTNLMETDKQKRNKWTGRYQIYMKDVIETRPEFKVPCLKDEMHMPSR